MNVKCSDGFIRTFIPAQSVGDHLRVHSFSISKAYCKHCKYKFTDKPTHIQKEDWRNHHCKIENLRRWQ